jgi:hypothetical protein
MSIARFLSAGARLSREALSGDAPKMSQLTLLALRAVYPETMGKEW